VKLYVDNGVEFINSKAPTTCASGKNIYISSDDSQRTTVAGVCFDGVVVCILFVELDELGKRDWANRMVVVVLRVVLG
jgi:hypothetical protein